MANDKSGTTVAAGTSTRSGVVTGPRPVELLIRKMSLEADLSEQDGDSVAPQVVAAILEADSLEAAIEAQDKAQLNGKSVADIEMTVISFEMAHSTINREGTNEPGGLKHYMWVDAINLENGEQFRFGTGAPNILAILWKAREKNLLPLDCVIRSKDQGGAKTLLTLRLLPKRVTRP